MKPISLLSSDKSFFEGVRSQESLSDQSKIMDIKFLPQWTTYKISMPTFDPEICKPWDFGDAEDETRPYGCRVCGWIPELPESHAEKQQEAKVRGALRPTLRTLLAETREKRCTVKACLETKLEINSGLVKCQISVKEEL